MDPAGMTSGQQEGNRELIAQQWLGRLNGTELDLGDGLIALVKPVTIMGLISAGRIPNALFAQAQRMVEGDQEDTKPEQIREVADLAKIICMECMVFPRIAKWNFQTREYEEERQPPEVIHFEDLGDEMIMAIVNYSQRGMKAIAQFRPPQGPGNQDRSDSPTVLPTAVTPSGS